ncbi:glycosyltransferase [Crocinitomicaceae bacterium]|nr:glycosyltransferase [Crocinitomicaceae bacterium]
METSIEWINYFLWAYGMFFALIALFGFSLQRNKERGYSEGEKISADEVTLLIPFRNESKNLPALLESISNLSLFPAEIIFINDHSEDDSVNLIQVSMEGLPIKIIHACEGNNGKKNAIREGAVLVETEFTLTWDADVVVDENYFKVLERLSKADMYVLPAIFSSKSFQQHLFTFDVVVANAVNTGLAGWRRPIFASGANLLYRSRKFEELDSIDKHAHISSGDDTFLLRDFTKNKAKVRLSTEPQLAITTSAPTTIKAYFSQRLRWVSKTNALGDWLNTFIAVKQLVLMIAFVTLLIWTLLQGFWFGLIYLIACKTMTDFLVFSAYFKQIKRSGLLLMLPFAEIWFPIYSIVLAAIIPLYRPKWKGRTIVSS